MKGDSPSSQATREGVLRCCYREPTGCIGLNRGRFAADRTACNRLDRCYLVPGLTRIQINYGIGLINFVQVAEYF